MAKDEKYPDFLGTPRFILSFKDAWSLKILSPEEAAGRILAGWNAGEKTLRKVITTFFQSQINDEVDGGKITPDIWKPLCDSQGKPAQELMEWLGVMDLLCWSAGNPNPRTSPQVLTHSQFMFAWHFRTWHLSNPRLALLISAWFHNRHTKLFPDVSLQEFQTTDLLPQMLADFRLDSLLPWLLTQPDFMGRVLAEKF